MTDEYKPDTEALLEAHRRGKAPSHEAERREQAFVAAIAEARPEDEPINDFAWARLKRAMAAEPQTTVKSWWRRAEVAPWQLAASVAAALALGQLTMVTRVASTDEAAVYETASAASETEVLRVAFQPDATEEEIRTLLLDQSAEIVAGPSALGLYSILPGEDSTLKELADALSSSPELVESVQLD